MKKRKLMFDSLAVSLFAVFSVIVMVFIIPDQISNNQLFGAEGNITARTYPYLLMWVMLICSICHIGQNFMTIKNLVDDEPYAKPEKEVAKARTIKNLKLAGVFALFVGFIYLFSWFGYAAACIVILPLVLAIQGSKKVGHYVTVLIFAASFYCIFYYVLNVNVPLYHMNF